MPRGFAFLTLVKTTETDDHNENVAHIQIDVVAQNSTAWLLDETVALVQLDVVAGRSATSDHGTT